MTLTRPLGRLRLGVNIDHVATVRNARGGALPRPAARGAARRGRRRRRHHRAPARGPPPHHRRRHRRRSTAALACRSTSRWRRRPRCRPSRCATGRTRSASSPRGARSAPPRAGSRWPRDENRARPLHRAAARRRAAGCRSSSPPTAARSRPRARIGAPVIELHTGAYCEHHARRRRRARATPSSRACARWRPSPHDLGLEVHAGHGLTYDNVGADRRDPAR